MSSPEPQSYDDFHVGDIVRNRNTGGKLVVRRGGTWLSDFYELAACPHRKAESVECQNPRGSWGTCIQALAAGWILADDLCRSCTGKFMAAIDGISGPLKWHPAYVDRAAGSREGVAQ